MKISPFSHFLSFFSLKGDAHQDHIQDVEVEITEENLQQIYRNALEACDLPLIKRCIQVYTTSSERNDQSNLY